MGYKKSLSLFLLNLLVFIPGVDDSSAQADEKSDRVAYTQASSSNLRTFRAADAEIVQKLPINTAVNILDKKGVWVSVQVLGEDSVLGWLHQSLLAKRPLTLEAALAQFDEVPRASLNRLKWIERAAALAPEDTDILTELAATLQFHRQYDQAELVLKNIGDIEARRARQQSGASPGTASAEKGVELLAFFKRLAPSDRIRGNFELADLEAILGMPVFVSGPHQNGRLDFNATESFGRYNPEFIRFVIHGLLSDAHEDSIYADLMRHFFKFYAYSDQLVRLGRAWCSIRNQPVRYNEFKKVYRKLIESGQPFSSFYNADLKGFWGPELEYLPVDLAFWARREWDGTSDLVEEAVAKALHWFDFVAYHQMADCFRAPGSWKINPKEYTLRPTSIVQARRDAQLSTEAGDAVTNDGGARKCLVWPSYISETADRCHCNDDLKNLEITLPANTTLMTACLEDWNSREVVDLGNTKVSLDKYDEAGSLPVGSLYIEGDLQVDGEIHVDEGPAGLLWFYPNWEYKNSDSIFRHQLGQFEFLGEDIFKISFKVSPEIMNRGCMSAPATIQISGFRVLIGDTDEAGAYPVNTKVLHVGDYGPCSGQ